MTVSRDVDREGGRSPWCKIRARRVWQTRKGGGALAAPLRLLPYVLPGPIAVGSPRSAPSPCTCRKAARSLVARLRGAFRWRKGWTGSYCSSGTNARCRSLWRGHTWAYRLLARLAFDATAQAMRARLCRVRYRLTPPPRPQTCKDCWHSGGLDFHVPDVLWRAVIDGQVWKVPGLGAVVDPVLCLACFDRRAEDRGVDYRPGLVVLGSRSWLVGMAKPR